MINISLCLALITPLFSCLPLDPGAQSCSFGHYSLILPFMEFIIKETTKLELYVWLYFLNIMFWGSPMLLHASLVHSFLMLWFSGITGIVCHGSLSLFYSHTLAFLLFEESLPKTEFTLTSVKSQYISYSEMLIAKNLYRPTISSEISCWPKGNSLKVVVSPCLADSAPHFLFSKTRHQ